VKLTPNPAPFRLSLGDRGEIAVCGLLKENGYEILEKNYKCKIGEIDVVARRDGRLAFIEVKTRTDSRFGMPQEAVDRKKQEKIFKLAQWYMKEKGLEKTPVAFDVVAVLWKEGRTPEIRLIVNAYEKEDKAY
jgi:putative endonuclease